MPEYIAKSAAMEIVKRTSGDYAAAFSEIRKLPAADVADVVHGEWVFTNAGWKCNICGHSMPYWPVASTQERTNYCPNCGCKMEKEDEK